MGRFNFKSTLSQQQFKQLQRKKQFQNVIDETALKPVLALV